MVRFAVVLLFAGVVALGPAVAQTPAKDQTQLPQSEEPGQEPQPAAPAAGTEQPPVQPPAAKSGEDLTQPPPADSGDETDTEESSPDDLSYGEIPDVTVIELTDSIARRALDALGLVRDKYKDANLENYESLQDFVDQTDEGKRFEADLKAAGFATVDEWNVAVTSVSFAYSAITENLTDDLTAQITEIEQDSSLAQDMKDRMIKGLKAMIPSENNKKVVQALIDDPAYAEKLKLLAEEGE
ncbi:hypothetical protein G5V57_26350 [Nordella sp. HKS 07]|uniref:hypothetical protein n=1 Tax=Nordella sp. HKS 07 TaxID=2712222 RepID=UPI0013E1D7D4|nr:hypothetical protein [Nordella sp. HKS 07]QIG50942.1 hypothetical protein G5V57_26350 [Nordella sp. HKS 07]